MLGCIAPRLMKVRFQADADLNQIILLATIRKRSAIDFQTAIAADLRGVDDPNVLARAAEEDRVLVTHDRKTPMIEKQCRAIFPNWAMHLTPVATSCGIPSKKMKLLHFQ